MFGVGKKGRPFPAVVQASSFPKVRQTLSSLKKWPWLAAALLSSGRNLPPLGLPGPQDGALCSKHSAASGTFL